MVLRRLIMVTLGKPHSQMYVYGCGWYETTREEQPILQEQYNFTQGYRYRDGNPVALIASSVYQNGSGRVRIADDDSLKKK